MRVKGKSSRWPLLLVFTFITALVVAFALERLPLYIIAAYAVISLFTFISYWLDKRKAQAGRWRIPEANLQLLSLIGGWPGALLAQSYLRHKSKKRAFLSVFWLTVLVNLAALSWVAGHGGQQFRALAL
ncbi:DUF1294 domain-containing protein [Rheinheimera pacifica]|uniref:DUF1294 domain-containing protein n=1 Tax=Rheinheimera pacifica TaxID=173990 RepID=UPI002ED9F911